jgi:hypothetical protein
MPWPVACVAMRKDGALGMKQAMRLAQARQYISPTDKCKGTEEHYNIFEALISGRNPSDELVKPSLDYMDTFNANVLRISSMAHKVCELHEENDKADSYLVICGRVNMLHGYGLPEKIWKTIPSLKDESYTLCTRQDSSLLALNKDNYKSELKNRIGYCAIEKTPPADLCFVCQDT